MDNTGNIESNKRHGYTDKAISGGFWIMAVRITQKTLGFLRTIILARFLAPNDFGLMGIALLALSTIELFSTTGFRSKLIQKTGETRDYLDTAWTLELIREIGIAIILLMAAKPIAIFFGNPAAVHVIRTLALANFVWGFNNIGTVLWRKSLNLKKEFVWQLSGGICDFGVAVVLAFLWKDVRALVYGFLAGQTVRVIMGYILCDYRPKIALDIEKAKELFSFGKWVLLSSIVVFLSTQGDDILLGKIMGVTALGFYQMAYKISNLTTTEITHSISLVALPVYSKIQNELPRLRDGFFRTLRLTLTVSVPMTILIIVLMPDFVVVILGTKWNPVIFPAQILALSGFIRSVMASFGPVFVAIGKPRYDFEMNLIRLGILALTIYPLMATWGIEGASISVLISHLLPLPFSYMKLKGLFQIGMKDVFSNTFPTLLSAAFTVAIYFLIGPFLPSGNFQGLIIKALVVSVSFAIILLLIDRIMQLNYLSDIKTMAKKLGAKFGKRQSI
ncbi:lipopolysaccharide biosynthesis protein [bacterium]|nr:lipopolysaccharide biosynthesis protein [bacterium]